MRPRSVPEPLDGELPRPDLVQRLQDRFRAPVVTVVAGAGFGKSTVMAQAARHNHVHPVGIDVWVTCRPGLEDAEQLGMAILDQLGTARSPRLGGDGPNIATIAASIERAITDVSPLDLCIVIDDVHQLPAGSSAERLTQEILRRLPDNGHLVLMSRTPPTLPLARLRAAGRVVEIVEPDLTFTSAEVGALATAAGRPAESVASLGGWPALVRLGLVAPAGADRDFLVEEVLASLSPDRRRMLLALALLGPADDAVLSRVVGSEVVAATALHGVPLVSRSADGRSVAHQLWDDALRTSFEPLQLHELQIRAIDALLEQGHPARAATIAIAMNDSDSLDRVALSMVQRHMDHIPLDIVRPWLDAKVGRGPALRTLEALVLYTLDARDRRADTVLDDVLAEAAASGDVDVESAALAATAVLANARQDMGRLFTVAVRADELSARDSPVLDLLRAGVRAIGCDLKGDPEGAIDALRSIEWTRVPLGAAQLIGRLYLQALWMAGRADESVAFADAWYRGDDSFLGGLPTIARWFAGIPGEAFADGIGSDDAADTNERNRFVGSCFSTMISASSGKHADVEAMWADGVVAGLGFANARDSAHLTYATAIRHVMRGDEAEAARVYRRHLDTYPVSDALGERHLRRFPATGYVLSPELRAHWDQCDLGPQHAAAIRSAHGLLAVRAGSCPGPLPGASAVVTHLPLPWTVELVAGLVEHDDPRGTPMWDEVVAVVGRPALDELERRRTPGPQHLPGASRLVARTPNTPASTTELLVLGPLEVRHAGRAVDTSELHRVRVRQLIQLLVMERSITRDRAQGLLWPDFPADAASKNLRVTLTHLRKALEPDRAAGSSGFHIRVDQRSITLHASEHLRVDAWEADSWHRRLDHTAALASERDALTELVALWRGLPYSDLDDVVALAGALEHVRQRHIDALLRLGELHIAAGTPTEARRLAREVLTVDPYCEQAHRLAIAADLRLDDVAATRRSVARLSAAMEELGVEVTPATRVLLHRVSMQVDDRRAPA